MAFSTRSVLQGVAAAALLVIPRGVMADNYLGCVAVSSTFTSLASAIDNSPETCKAACSGNDFKYYGVAQQFCACTNSAPVVSKSYADSACNRACSAPYQAETCGGEDSSTFELLYNLYEISSNGATTSTTTSKTTTLESQTTTDNIATIPTTQTTPATPTDGSTITTTGIATQAPIVHAANPAISTVDTTVFISIIDCSCTDSNAPNTVVTSTVKMIETIPCSEGETNISGQCFASTTTSTTTDINTILSSSTATIHSALATKSSPTPPSDPISTNSSIPPASLRPPISSVSSDPTSISSLPCSAASCEPEVSLGNKTVVSSSTNTTLISTSASTSSATPSISPDSASTTSGSGSPGNGSNGGGVGHAINAVLGSSNASTNPVPSLTSFSSIASSPTYHYLNANSSTTSSVTCDTLSNDLLAVPPTSSPALISALLPASTDSNVSTPASTSTPASSSPSPPMPFNSSYQYATTKEVLITVVPLSTAPTTLSTLTSNRQNGPYANGTTTSSRYSAPSYLSASAYASGNSMIVTAAGAPAFEQVSVLSKEWYLSMLYVYPIKALRGIALSTAEVGPQGVRYDRRFMLLTAERNKDGILKKMQLSSFPECALFSQEIVDAIDVRGQSNGGNKDVIVHYHPPERSSASDSLPHKVSKMSVNNWSGMSPVQHPPLRVSLDPCYNSLVPLDVNLHGSPARGYRMGDSYDEWFSACFGFDVVLVYIGDGQRQVLGETLKLGVPGPNKMSAKRSAVTAPPSGDSLFQIVISSIAALWLALLVVLGVRPKTKDKPDEPWIAFSDCAPLLVTAESSLRNVSARMSEGVEVPMYKFRPNIVVDGEGEEAWAEDFWGELTVTRGRLGRESSASSVPSLSRASSTSSLVSSASSAASSDDVSDDASDKQTQSSVRLLLTSNCARCSSLNVDYATGMQAAGELGEVLKRLSKDRRVDPGTKYSPVFGRYAFLGQLGNEKSPDGSVDAGDDYEGAVRIAVGDEVTVARRNAERTVWDWPNL
ncbi:hypothetical protein SEPCBS57363_004069 [Sporothrix epigloea]|uniref:WSC domain-containing protein n=1 Tax=Sporothrix epigloea TaxID=1892477 RepID=A0ABP0DQ08_9PEZI